MNQFWTEEEDERLRQLLATLEKDSIGRIRKNGYVAVMKEFPTRTRQSLYNRIGAVLSAEHAPTYDRKHGGGFGIYWTTDEIQKLATVVESLPKRSNGALRKGGVEKLSKFFPGRSENSIRAKMERLPSLLRPKRTFNCAPWTDEEIAKIREVYSRDSFRLDLEKNFLNRKPNEVVAKATELGLTRRRLSAVPFKLSSEEAAFAAGMMLADGHFSMVLRPKRAHLRMINIGFTNTERELIDWFVKRIPRGIVNTADRRGEKSIIPIRKICYQWRLHDQPTTYLFIGQILPYLHGVKKERARLIFEYLHPLVAKDGQ